MAKEGEHFFMCFLNVCVSFEICLCVLDPFVSYVSMCVHLLFNVLGFFTYSVRCASGKACLLLSRDYSVNSLLCRNLKKLLCVYLCVCLCAHVYACVCKCMYVCVYTYMSWVGVTLVLGKWCARALGFKESSAP